VLGPINEKQEKVLRVGRDNINRLSRIINSLLDISKIEAGRVELKREEIELADLVQQVALSFEPLLKEKGLELRVQVPAGGLPVYVDSDKMIQIFTNLVGNAAKFTEKGSITISARDQGSEVECRVSDTGIGIAREDLPRVFNRFQQFARKAGAGERGTGLGLAITKGLVELHGGAIRVESESGKGTAFIFTLPKHAPGEAKRAVKGA
ncbi:MAG: HAMP domain-containing histidine kinase, partial [Candidatus Omnitrophica bacterium]|nr:HAMP domain-containing histidine kinase [Candidatus Omnitrophota bacterium]